MCSNHYLLKFIVCVALCYVEILFFNLNRDFAHLIRSVGKVAPSVKLISSNHSYSTTTIFLQNNLNFIVGCVICFFNYISSKFISNS